MNPPSGDGSIESAAKELGKLDLFGLKPKEQVDDTPEEEVQVAEEEVEVEAQAEAEAEPEVTEDAEEVDAEDPAPTSLQTVADALETDVDELYGVQIPIKVDGEESLATIKDLQKSYQLERHLHRKSQELSDQGKKLEADFAERTQKAVSETESHLAVAKKYLLTDYEAVNWSQLKVDDPQQFLIQKQEFAERELELNSAIEGFNSDRQKESEAATTQYREWLTKEQQDLPNVIPEWNDRETKEAEFKVIDDYLVDLGFNDTERTNLPLYGNRYLRIARDAAKYRELQKKKPQVRKKLSKAPKILSASQKKRPPKKGVDDAHARLKKSGSIDDVAELLKTRRASRI